MNYTFERIDGPLQARFDNVHFFSSDGFQYIIRRILPRGRTPDPNFDPHELWGAKRLDNGLDAVVSPMPPGKLDPEASRFEVEIVVHHDKIVGGELQFAKQAFERGTRDIHEVEGAGQFDQFGTEPP